MQPAYLIDRDGLLWIRRADGMHAAMCPLTRAACSHTCPAWRDPKQSDAGQYMRMCMVVGRLGGAIADFRDVLTTQDMGARWAGNGPKGIGDE